MPTPFLARSTEGVRSFSLGSGARRTLLLVCCVGLFLLTVAFHLVTWSTASPMSMTVRVVYAAVVVVCYGGFWLLLQHRLRDRPSSPSRTFWTLLVSGFFVLGLGLLLASLKGPAPAGVEMPTDAAIGFDQATGVPLTWLTVVQMSLIGLLGTGFAFVLLLRLRDLALFKRTKRSVRNWVWMVALMVAVALVAALKEPAEDKFGVLVVVFMIPAIGLMVVNAFRVSWIVYLSFWEKMAVIGLSLLLLGLLSGGLYMLSEDVTGMGAYLWHYSPPLYLFLLLSIIFAILYCLTAFLSLLFHLPTTSDFERKAGEMAALQSLTDLVGQVFDRERLVETIAASPVEAGAAHSAWLALADPAQGSLQPRIEAVSRIDAADVRALVDVRALYEEAAQQRRPLLLDEAAADHRISARPGDAIGTLLVVPLVARDEVLGTLFVTQEVTHGFERDDIEAVNVFAAQAALALDNARLFEEQLEKERLERELDIAREVQRKLLPQCLPSVSGLSICAASVPAQEVGGDYYDFVQLSDDRLAFIIADVSGKGTSAAFYMAEMQGIFQSGSRLTDSPTDFLTHANHALSDSLEKNTFISVIYGVVDLKDEEIRLARAGHCPAAMIDLGGQARYLRSRGLGLGLDRGTLFEKSLTEERHTLRPGDVFVLYTDGVVESRGPDGEEYGYERLLEALGQNRHEDANDLHGALLHDLHAFTGHSAYDDDMTLVVLKWHGLELPRSRPVQAPLEHSAPEASG